MYEVPPSDPRLPMKMRAAGIGGLYAKVQFNLKLPKARGSKDFFDITINDVDDKNANDFIFDKIPILKILI